MSLSFKLSLIYKISYMENRLTDQQIEEIEEFLLESSRELDDFIETDTNLNFFDNKDIENNLESLYLSHYSEEEMQLLQHNGRKIYRDAVYYGDLLDKNRHGLGKMEYHSGRIYYGE